VASAWHSTPEEFHAALSILNAALKGKGKDPAAFPNAVDTMFMFIHRDGSKARQVAAPIIEKATRASFDGPGGHYLVGSYQECQALLERWIKAGAKQICLWPVVDPVEQIRSFGEHLLPNLR
jgi:alkanesulfonate monooxygenase SsuD/methylene tetrahydromethanopterin reductase-like flavin-dependent oxidoreductase (luciferase family)